MRLNKKQKLFLAELCEKESWSPGCGWDFENSEKLTWRMCGQLEDMGLVVNADKKPEGFYPLRFVPVAEKIDLLRA